MAVKIIEKSGNIGKSEMGNAFEDVLDMFVTDDEHVPAPIATIVANMQETYSLDEKTNGVKITLMSKDTYFTSYSFAIISEEFVRGNVSKVGYFILMFTETGVDGLAPMTILEKTRIGASFELASIALDKTIIDISKTFLMKEYGVKETALIASSGFEIKPEFDGTDIPLVVKTSNVCFNAIKSKVMIEGFGIDVDTQMRNVFDKHNIVTFDVSKLTGNDNITNIMGSSMFTEWCVDVVAKNNIPEAINKKSGRTNLGRVYGFMGSLFVEVEETIMVQQGPNMPATQMPIKKYKLQPSINVNVIDPTKPISSIIIMLALSTTAVATKWKEIIETNVKEGRDPSTLNKIIDIKNAKISGGTPKISKINVNDKIENKMAEISKYYTTNPIVIMDIPTFGYGTSFLSDFTKASGGDNDALDRILISINKLTRNETAGKINRNEVFARASIDIPDGTYGNKGGKDISLDKFDAQRLAAITDDEVLIKRFANALSGNTTPGYSTINDPFRELISIYAEISEKFGTRINIKGVKKRVFINGGFLNKIKIGLEASKVRIEVPDYTASKTAISFASNANILNAGIDTQGLMFASPYQNQQHGTVNPFVNAF